MQASTVVRRGIAVGTLSAMTFVVAGNAPAMASGDSDSKVKVSSSVRAPVSTAPTMNLAAGDVASLNRLARAEGASTLPAGVRTLTFKVDGSVEARDARGRQIEVQPGWWGTAWKVAQCGAAVGTFIAGNMLLIYKIKKIGGVTRAAKLLVNAENAEQRWKAAALLFGEVTGLGAIVSSCS
jgi:hypothetical protein